MLFPCRNISGEELGRPELKRWEHVCKKSGSSLATIFLICLTMYVSGCLMLKHLLNIVEISVDIDFASCWKVVRCCKAETAGKSVFVKFYAPWCGAVRSWEERLHFFQCCEHLWTSVNICEHLWPSVNIGEAVKFMLSSCQAHRQVHPVHLVHLVHRLLLDRPLQETETWLGQTDGWDQWRSWISRCRCGLHWGGPVLVPKVWSYSAQRSQSGISSSTSSSSTTWPCNLPYFAHQVDRRCHHYVTM